MNSDSLLSHNFLHSKSCGETGHWVDGGLNNSIKSLFAKRLNAVGEEFVGSSHESVHERWGW